VCLSLLDFCDIVSARTHACFVCRDVHAQRLDLFLQCYLFCFSFLFYFATDILYSFLMLGDDFSFFVDLFLLLGKLCFVLFFPVCEFLEYFIFAALLDVQVACFVRLDLVAKFLVFERLIAVFLEVFEVAMPLFEDDFGFVEFILDFSELVHRLLFFLFIEADACDLFDDLSSLVRAHFDESYDISLQDDVVSVRIDACAVEQLNHFLSCSCLAVNFVFARAVSSDDSANLDFIIF